MCLSFTFERFIAAPWKLVRCDRWDAKVAPVLLGRYQRTKLLKFATRKAVFTLGNDNGQALTGV
jgi:hypothetical protein